MIEKCVDDFFAKSMAFLEPVNWKFSATIREVGLNSESKYKFNV